MKISEILPLIQSGTITDENRSSIVEALTALDAEKSKADRASHVAQLASKTGCNPIVLEALTKDLEIEKLVIQGDTATIDGTDLKSWIEGDATRSCFAPALFPNGMPSQKFPSGAPSPAIVDDSLQKMSDAAAGRDRSKTDWIGRR